MQSAFAMHYRCINISSTVRQRRLNTQFWLIISVNGLSGKVLYYISNLGDGVKIRLVVSINFKWKRFYLQNVSRLFCLIIFLCDNRSLSFNFHISWIIFDNYCCFQLFYLVKVTSHNIEIKCKCYTNSEDRYLLSRYDKVYVVLCLFSMMFI